MLVGYDGKTWTEYTMVDETNTVTGECATDGRLNEGRANRFAGGAAWFIMGGGVLRFDGQHWSYQKMQQKTEFTPGSNTWWFHNKIWLAVSPDGKVAVACNSINNFWIYREGQWTQRVIADTPDVEAGSRKNEEPLALVLNDNDTAWYQTMSGKLRQIRVAPEPKAKEAPDVAALSRIFGTIVLASASKHPENCFGLEHQSDNSWKVRWRTPLTLNNASDWNRSWPMDHRLKQITAHKRTWFLVQFISPSVGRCTTMA